MSVPSRSMRVDKAHHSLGVDVDRAAELAVGEHGDTGQLAAEQATQRRAQRPGADGDRRLAGRLLRELDETGELATADATTCGSAVMTSPPSAGRSGASRSCSSSGSSVTACSVPEVASVAQIEGPSTPRAVSTSWSVVLPLAARPRVESASKMRTEVADRDPLVEQRLQHALDLAEGEQAGVSSSTTTGCVA